MLNHALKYPATYVGGRFLYFILNRQKEMTLKSIQQEAANTGTIKRIYYFSGD